MAQVLYAPNSHAPIICERPNWKNCPEHKHLSTKCPKIDKMKDLGLEGFSSDDSGFMSVEYYNAIGSSGSNPNYDPKTDPFYNPNDPNGKLSPNMGNACQKCGEFALTVNEAKGGFLNRKVTDTQLICGNCGRIQRSTIDNFL